MTFPIAELLCPECQESMTVINTPKLQKSSKKGYDEKVEFHYKCLSNDRHKGGKWCRISTDAEIYIFSLYMPNLELDDSSPTTTTTTQKKKYSWIGDYLSSH